MEKVRDAFQEKVYGADAYKNMHSRLMEFPILIDVEPSSACNLDCLFCARQNMTRSATIMALDKFRTVVDEVKGYPPSSIRFSGWGEPTLNPRIVDFVRYASGQDVLTHLTSNATTMTPELAEGLLLAGLNKVKFSLQGLTPGEYNRMRPGRSQEDSRSGYERITENIDLFVDVRNRLGASCHVQVSVSMLAPEQERIDLQQQFYDRWYPLVDSIWGLGKVGVYGGKPLLTSFQRVKSSARLTAEDMCQGRPVREDDVNNGKKCTELYNKLSISADGTVKACCDDYDNFLALGKVGSGSIKALWDGEQLSRLRSCLESGDGQKIPDFCKGCDNYF